MAEHEGTETRNNLPDGETIPQEPLGIKNPLLPPNPLGQKLLNPKFLHPLGARSITVFNPSGFFSEEMSDEFPPDNPFKNSPFFAESQDSQLSESVDVDAAPISADAALPVMRATNPTLVQPVLATEPPAQKAAAIDVSTALQTSEITKAIASSPSPSTIQRTAEIDEQTAPIAAASEITKAIASSSSPSTIQRAVEIDEQTAPIAAASEITNAIASSSSPSTIQRAVEIDEQTAPIAAASEITNAIASSPSSTTPSSVPTETLATAPKLEQPLLQTEPDEIQRAVEIDEQTAPIAAASEITNAIASSSSPSTIQRTAAIEASTTPDAAKTLQASEISNAIAISPSSTTPSSAPSNPTTSVPTLEQPLLQTESSVQRTAAIDASTTLQTSEISNAIATSPSPSTIQRTAAIEASTTPDAAATLQASEISKAIATSPSSTTPSSAPLETLTTVPTLEQPLLQTEPHQVQRATEIDTPTALQTSEITNAIATSPSSTTLSSVPTETTATEPRLGQAFLDTESQVQRAPAIDEQIAPNVASAPPETIASQPTLGQTLSDTEPQVQRASAIEELTSFITAPEQMSQVKNALADSSSPTMPSSVQPDPAVIEPTVEQPLLQAELQVQKAQMPQPLTAPQVASVPPETELELTSAVSELTAVSNLTTSNTVPEVTTDRVVVQPLSETEAANHREATLSNVTEPIESPMSFSAVTEAESVEMPAIASDKITVDRSDSIAPATNVESLVQKAPVLSVATEPDEPPLSQKTEDAIASTNSIQVPESTTTPDAIVQAKLATESASEDLTGLAQDAIASTTDSIQVPESTTTSDTTVIQAKLATESASEDLTRLAKDAIASTNSIQVPESTTTPDTTVIQAKLATESASKDLTRLAKDAIASTNSIQVPESTTTPDAIVQAKLATESASEDLTGLAKDAIASITDSIQVPESTTTSDTTVIQAKLATESASKKLTGLAEDAIASTSSANPPVQVPQSTQITEPTVIQPLVETEPLEEREELPQLPQVLTNLSILSPLAQQSNLLASPFSDTGSKKVEASFLAPITSNFSPASEQSIPIQRMPEESWKKNQEATAFPSSIEQVQAATSSLSSPSETLPSANSSTNTREIPTSWSSIFELLGESTPKASESIVVQPLSEPRTWDAAPKPIVSKASDYNSSQSNISQPMINSQQNNSLGNVIQTYSMPSRRTSASGMEALIQLMGEADSQVGAIDQSLSSVDDSSPEEAADNLEILAREVYSFIRQRLEIERERRGNNYSGRLPW
ncbi:hypothetical protein [Coleofasciculus sp. H7-2]|uniref:hypothetical protein n=1 Tax=Coleofasciculus sp. H7-2 TaxID=3351545 RepID=UPI0036713772